MKLLNPKNFLILFGFLTLTLNHPIWARDCDTSTENVCGSEPRPQSNVFASATENDALGNHDDYPVDYEQDMRRILISK